MLCRWNTDDEHMGFRVYSTKERAEAAISILKKMIAAGADANAIDSYGNSCLNRFGLQANRILPPYDYFEHCERKGRKFTQELHEDLKLVLTVLFVH